MRPFFGLNYVHKSAPDDVKSVAAGYHAVAAAAHGNSHDVNILGDVGVFNAARACSA